MAMVAKRSPGRTRAHSLASSGPTNLIHVICAVGDRAFALAGRAGVDASRVPHADNLSSASKIHAATWVDRVDGSGNRYRNAGRMDFIRPTTRGICFDNWLGQSIPAAGLVLLGVEFVPLCDAGLWHTYNVVWFGEAYDEEICMFRGAFGRLFCCWRAEFFWLVADARAGAVDLVARAASDDRHGLGQPLVS